MSAKEKKKGTTRRFGARYGIKVRENIEKVEALQKAKQKCPYCKYVGGIRRLAAGIFICKKCENKFTGKAYFIGKVAATQATEDDLVIDLDKTLEKKDEADEDETQ